MAQIVPDFVDPASGGPLPGREEQWGLIAEYRVFVARDARQWYDLAVTHGMLGSMF